MVRGIRLICRDGDRHPVERLCEINTLDRAAGDCPRPVHFYHGLPASFPHRPWAAKPASVPRLLVGHPPGDFAAVPRMGFRFDLSNLISWFCRVLPCLCASNRLRLSQGALKPQLNTDDHDSCDASSDRVPRRAGLRSARSAYSPLEPTRYLL